MNSQKKGKRFELQVAKYLSREFKYEIRRTPNSGGLSIKGDIIATQGILAIVTGKQNVYLFFDYS